MGGYIDSRAQTLSHTRSVSGSLIPVHTLNINQTKSLSTQWWCHCRAIIHPRGYSGQHRSVLRRRSIQGPTTTTPTHPHSSFSAESCANQGWWVFMNNTHGDSSARMKMDSWPTLTRPLEKKKITQQKWKQAKMKKKPKTNEKHLTQSEVSGIITL